jgi:hypothetical protein
LYEFKDFGCGCARAKDGANLAFKEGVTIVVRDDAASEHNDIVEPFSSQQFTDLWEQVSMGA